MLDIKFIRENRELVKTAAINKNRQIDVDRLIAVDDERRRLIGEVERLREERNKLAKLQSFKEAKLQQEGKKLKEEINRYRHE